MKQGSGWCFGKEFSVRSTPNNVGTPLDADDINILCGDDFEMILNAREQPTNTI